MTVKALIITSTGLKVRQIEPTLTSLQALVGGDIESVTLDGSAHLYIG